MAKLSELVSNTKPVSVSGVSTKPKKLSELVTDPPKNVARLGQGGAIGALKTVNASAQKAAEKKTTAPTPLMSALSNRTANPTTSAIKSTKGFNLPTANERMKTGVLPATEYKPINTNAQNTILKPTFGNRISNVLSGGVKSAAADYESGGGVIMAAKGGTEMTSIYDEQIAENQRDLDANKALLARTDLSDKQRAEIQDQIKVIEGRLSTYTKASTANKEVGTKLLDESTKTSQSAQQNILAAKQGLGKVGSLLVDTGVAGVQMGTDLAGSLLTGGTVNPLTVTASRVFGSSAKTAIDNGATYDEAINRGALAAITTYGISKLSSASTLAQKFAGQGATDTFTKSVIAKLAEKLGKTAAGKAVITKTGNLLASGVGEGVEEMLEDAVAPVLDAITYQGKSGLNQYADADYYANMLYDGLVGGVMGTIAGSVDVVAKPVPKSNITTPQTSTQNTANNVDVPTTIAPNVSTKVNTTQNAAQAPTVNESAKENVEPVAPQLNEQAKKALMEAVENPYFDVGVKKSPIVPINENEVLLYRRINTGEQLRGKAQGLYTTPVYDGNAYTPHEDAGDADVFIKANITNPLKVPIEKAKVRGFQTELSSGASALKTLSPLDYDALINMKKADAIQYIKEKYPSVDISGFNYDTYELIETLGAELARNAGYDALVLTDSKNPLFDEYVLLTDNFTPVTDKQSQPTQSATEHSTINESAKEVKLPVETENALKTQLGASEAKTNIFPENSIGAKITTPNDAVKKSGEAETHIDNRTMDSVKARKTNSFQYDHPELHQYFEYSADLLSMEVENQMANDFMRPAAKKGSATEARVGGRYKAKGAVKTLMDAGLTKPQILQCLQDIKNDHGSENYAAAKRVELVLDDMMTNGYVAYTGDVVPTIDEYVKAKQAIEGAKTNAQRQAEYDEAVDFIEGTPSTSIFPENSLGAKITTPKSTLPQGTGAKSANVEYKETPTQSKAYDATYTEMEKAAMPELQNTHQVKGDKGVDARVQERLDFDYEGEKADLFNDKQDWDVDDTRLAAKILETEVAKARQTQNWDEVIKLQKKYAAQGTDWGQVGRQRQRFTNTPAEIVAESATTLSNIEAEEKGKARTSKQIAEDSKAKEQSNEVGKAIHKSTKEAADKISKSYSNYTKKVRFTNLKTVEGNQVGEPFTFEYDEKVGELLANSVEKSVTSTPKQQKTFLKEIATQLKAFAKETLPAKVAPASKITATEKLGDYLANKEFYSNAWSSAQDELRRRYANDPDMLASLENFTNSTIGFRGNPSDRNTIMIRSLVNSAIESGETKQVLRLQETLGFTKTADNIANDLINKTGATGTDAEIIRAAASQYVNDVLATSELDATKTVNAKVKSAMHDIGVTISDTVTKNAKEKAGISKAVTDLLVNKYGLGTADASNVANVVNEHFNKLVSDATQKKLESIFNKTKTTANVKPFMQKLTEMINMGVFDSDQYSEAAAEKLFGLKTQESGLTSEKFKDILKTISDSADKLNGIAEGDTTSTIALIKDLNKIRKTTGLFTDETSKKMSGWLERAAKLPDGDTFLRDVAAQQIRNIASDYQKTSVLNAIKSYRIMGMLSKVTTLMRNFVSNSVIDPVDSIAGNMVIPVDMLLSKITGTRSVPVDKSWFSEAKRKGSVDGFIKSAIQVGLDADVSENASKYETTSGRTFKMTGNPIERFLSTWSKWENYALQSTDEFAKGGISAEAQRGIDSLKSKGLVAKDALTDRASEVAKQRTLQNDGMLATAMVKGRNAANIIGVKDKRGGSFGLGDLLVPFAKVPANATAMVTNFTPAGLVKATTNLSKTLIQAHNGTLTADQQAKAVTDLGRALSGTAGVAMFTGLAIVGIIKVAGSDDKDKEALETSEGQRGTQFNISALGRWLSGKSTKWQDGDTLVSIGFMEQINGQMVMGAMIADAYKEDGSISFGDVANSNATAVFQSVLELPAMSQLTELVNGYRYSDADKIGGKLADATVGYLSSQASSFVVPNIVGGVATGLDGTVRNTYSSENPLIQAKDNILSKIPFARNTLPAKLDNYGNERKYTGSKPLDILNANILPGQIGKYSTSAVNQELYRLNTKYPSRNSPSNIEFNKKTYALSADEKAQYQKTKGQLQNSFMQKMINSNAYKSMTDEQKSDALSDLMSYSEFKAKKEYFSSKGIDYTSDTFKGVYSAEQKGINPADFYAYKTKLHEIDTDGDNATQLQITQAIQSTDLTTAQKGALWQLQNSESSGEKNPYTGTLAQKGLSPQKTIEIMEAFNNIDTTIDDKYVKTDGMAGGQQVKAAYLNQWLTRQGYTSAQITAITDVFTTWQMIPIEKPSKKATAFVAANPMP